MCRHNMTLFILWLLLALALAYHARGILFVLPNIGHWDFPIFLQHAHEFIKTGVLYNRDLAAYSPAAPVYKFPPLYAAILVLSIKSGITETTIYYAAWFIQIACFISSLLLLPFFIKEKKASPIIYPSIFVFALLNDTFLENSLGLQLEPYIMLLLTLAIVACSRNKIFHAGFFIGIATMLKIYPGFLIIYFLFSKKWQGFYGCVIACAACTILTLFVISPGEHLFFFKEILPLIGTESTRLSDENISISHVAHYIIDNGILANISGKLVFLAGVVVVTTSIYNNKNLCDPEKIALTIATLLMAILIGMPNSWRNYQILLCIPVAIAITIISRQPKIPVVPAGCILTTIPLLMFSSCLSLSCAHIKSLFPISDLWLLVYPRTMANLLIFFALLYLQKNIRRT